MPLSVSLTDVASYQAYVQDYYDQLIVRAFYSPRTLQYATAHEGVKGKKTLTRLKVATGKAVAWKSDFSAATDAVSMHPRTLEVAAIKRDLSFTPQDFEATYLGQFRQRGQNPGEDLPFEAFIMQAILNGHAEELEAAFWQGVKAGSVTPGTTPMAECFDGFLHIIADAVTATTLTEYPTPGGAITTTNIVELLEGMWGTLGAAYKEQEVLIFLSWANFQKYQQGYRESYGVNSNWNPRESLMTLDFSMNAKLVPMPGMGTSDRIVMTPRGNLHIGYDDFGDAGMFEFEKSKRQMDFWMDFKVGCQIAQIDEDALVVNDLT